MSNDKKFNYTYSAPNENERREIESIKKQYAPAADGENKLERLRSLNKRVNQPPLILAVVIGVIGTLIMGFGMTMVLEWNCTVWGAVVGVFGVAFAAAAYPIRRALLQRNKRKYGQQIIELSNELLNMQEN